MTEAEPSEHPSRPAFGRFWFMRRIAPYVSSTATGFLPCADLVTRYRIRRTAKNLVALQTWPGMEAESAEVAQLAMLRLLYLQRETHRAVRGRHREASAMLARTCVEALFLGIYCMRVPEAIAQLHAGNLKAMIDGLAYLEEIGIAPADVIKQCVVKLGEPGRRHLTAWDLVKAIDNANGNQAARSLYRRLYVPLSNLTVHASGLALLRHVRADGQIRPRPAHFWARRSPTRVADAAMGYLAADLAQRAGQPDKQLVAYADKHMRRTLMPMAIMAFSGGVATRSRVLRLPEVVRLMKDVYKYLWTSPGLNDPIDVRAEYVRQRFSLILDSGELDIPADALDPFIDYVVEKLATAAPEQQD